MSEFNGIVNLDKPAGPSSARIVGRVKRLLPRGTKIGHAGTLDPFAAGVLLLLVGRATRQCERLMNQPKEYEAVVKLGASTDTDDSEGTETPTPGAAAVPLDRIEAVLGRFTGTIQQRPPRFSAMKVGGRRAYDLARTGQAVVLPPRPVRIYRIDLLGYDWPLLRLRIACGRGTYVRALARDIGHDLGVGGYLTALVRTAVGEYRLEVSVSLQQLEAEGIDRHLLPTGEAGNPEKGDECRNS